MKYVLGRSTLLRHILLALSALAILTAGLYAHDRWWSEPELDASFALYLDHPYGYGNLPYQRWLWGYSSGPPPPPVGNERNRQFQQWLAEYRESREEDRK